MSLEASSETESAFPTRRAEGQEEGMLRWQKFSIGDGPLKRFPRQPCPNSSRAMVWRPVTRMYECFKRSACAAEDNWGTTRMTCCHVDNVDFFFHDAYLTKSCWSKRAFLVLLARLMFIHGRSMKCDGAKGMSGFPSGRASRSSRLMKGRGPAWTSKERYQYTAIYLSRPSACRC